MASALDVRGLSFAFGAVQALSGIDLEVSGGEFVGLIGPNGSGKTTLFNCLTGFLKPAAGEIRLGGRNITRWPPHRIARLGLIRTFQQSMSFASGTTRESLEMALAITTRGDTVQSGSMGVDQLLDLTGLHGEADQLATSLPYGTLRKLGVAMALAARPRILLLDEPAAGLSGAEAAEFGSMLHRVRRTGLTLMVVDHDMDFLLPQVERLIVLDAGRKLADGNPEEVQRHPDVITAYLGTRFGTVSPEHAQPSKADVVASQEVPVIEARGIHVSYGGVAAVTGVDLVVQSGETVAIMGPNGAGKSSLLRAISQLVPYDGTVALNGSVETLSPEHIASGGVGHVLEGRHVFAQLSVKENLEIARIGRHEEGFDDDLEAVLELFPLLREKWRQSGGELSGGQQQSLVIARALLTRPAVLLMDEPSLGLAPVIIEQLAAAIPRLRREWGLALLVAEQSLSLVMDIADRCYVLRRGSVVYEGPMWQPGIRERLLTAYLGAGESDILA